MSDGLLGVTHDRVVQLIPATGWWLAHALPDALSVAPLVAWGLMESGYVVPLDTDERGDVVIATECVNYAGVVHDPFYMADTGGAWARVEACATRIREENPELFASLADEAEPT